MDVKPAEIMSPNRRLLIFDLDETLVHASTALLEHKSDFTYAQYFVYLRPHLAELLAAVSPHYDLAVWSSASSDYVEHVSARLFTGLPLKFSWSIERCIQRIDLRSGGYVYIKDLRKVQGQGYTLDRVIMVDDTPEKISRQPRNHLLIAAYRGEENDTELLSLIETLLT